MLLIFLGCLLFMLYLTFLNSGKDILAPSVLMLLGYILTAVFTIYNIERWNTSISEYALFIVFIGIVSYLLGEYFAKHIRIRKSYRQQSVLEIQLKDLTQVDQKWKIWVTILICLVCTVLLYNEMVRIAYSDFKSWGNLVYNYKVNKAEYEMSGIGKLAGKVTKAAAFVYLFTFSNKVTEQSKVKFRGIKKNLLYLIPGIIYCIQQLFLGARIGIIGFLVALFVLIGICNWLKYQRRWKINIKTIIKTVVMVIVVFILFFQIKETVGRQQDSEGVIDYVATYLGGSLDLFSQYIRNPMGSQNNLETFSGIINNAQSYLNIFMDVSFTTSHEYRNSATGVAIGNTYTGFRSYYNDYGIFGVIGLTFGLAIIISGVYYYLLRNRKMTRIKLTLIVIYASQIYCIPFHFFTDYFYTKISWNLVVECILIWLMVCFVYRKRDFKIKEGLHNEYFDFTCSHG